MVAYTYSRVHALNYNTTPPTVARSATGSVYAIADTTFTTPLNVTMVVGGVVTAALSSGTMGEFPDFTVTDRTSVVWKQNSSSFTTVLTTTDPVPGATGATGAAGAAGVKGDRGDLATWQANTFYPLNQVIANPSGDLVKVTTAHTSGTTYDATKFGWVNNNAANLTGLLPEASVPTRLTDTSLNATYASRWKTAITYAVGDKVLNPSGDIVTANVAHTSAAAYATDAAKWDLSPSYAKTKLPTGPALGTTQTVINRTNGTAVCIGVDQQNANGSIWFADVTNGVLVQSDDANATQSNKGWPTNVTSSAGYRIVRFASLVLLLAVDNVDGKVKVWSAPYVAQATAFTWSAPLLTLTAGSTIFQASMEVSNWASDNRIIVTEYGDPTGGPSAWISTDGATFTKRFGPDATMRHIHHAAFDPNNPGHIWMTCGDGIAKTVMKSTDHGLTWATVVVSSEFQAVQISFTRDWVFLAGDSRRGTVMVVDRATNTPRWASRNYHHDIPPARLATGARKVTTLAFTVGSSTVTSTGEFTTADQRRYLTAGNGILPADTYVVTVTPPNSLTLNRNALATVSAQPGVIYGDMYLSNAYYGAVDPASGVYYCVANDTSNSGNMQGMFYLDQPGGHVNILDPGGENISMNGFVFCYRGRVWSGMWSRPLMSVL